MDIGNILLAVAAVLACLVFYLLWDRGWLAHWFASDRLDLVWVVIDRGNQVEHVKGRRAFDNEHGEVFVYTYEGRRRELKIPTDYPVRFWKRRRLVAVNLVTGVAAPFGTVAHGGTMSELALSQMTLGYTVNEGIKSIKAQAMLKLGSLLIIGVVVVAGAVGVWYWQGHKAKPAPNGNTNAGQQGMAPSQDNGPTLVPVTTPTPGGSNGR